MNKIHTLLFVLLSIHYINSHPTIYDNFPRNPICLGPNPPTPVTWHVHVIYDLVNKEMAYEMRKKSAEFLKLNLDDEKHHCTNLDFLPDKLDVCYFDIEEEPEKGSPFWYAQFAFLFYPKDFYRIVTWFLQFKEDLDLYIRPNSGCAISDHTFYALYAGRQRFIDGSIFSKERNPFIQSQLKILKDLDSSLDDDEISNMTKSFLRHHDSE